MSQRFILIVLIAVFPFAAEAQLNNILKRAKNKAEQRANNKVDEAIDKTLDAAEGKNTGSSEAPSQPKPATPAKTETEEPVLKSFYKFDFVPGDSVLYYDNFEGEALSELPASWNTSGSGEVTTLDKYPGNWLRLHKSNKYLSGNLKQFGENYTIEFDLILQLKNNGWMYPEFNIGLFATGDQPGSSNVFLTDYDRNASVTATIIPAEYKTSKLKMITAFEGKSYFASDTKTFESLDKLYGTPVHVAIQVQKERFRMWVNEEKFFDVPKGVPAGSVMNQLIFNVGFTNYAESQYGVFVSNIKVATGKSDTRHKLVEEGRFSTTGILFDFQSAVIKPESYAVVKEIAGVLKENPSIKVKVLGHTSSDGDDNANMELSKKRAAAVRDMLATEFGIDAARIETEGKGETQPVADNKTKEGKMLNRRVEFNKL